METVQNHLVHQDIAGTTNKSRERIGQRRRKTVQGEIQTKVEEARGSHLVQLGCQDNSTKWNVP